MRGGVSALAFSATVAHIEPPARSVLPVLSCSREMFRIGGRLTRARLLAGHLPSAPRLIRNQ